MSAHEVYWHHGARAEPGPALDHDLDVDFLIVGGGYTGLSAARFLKEAEPSMSVAVLERRWVGYGASGRNTGFLTSLVGHDLSSVLRRYGLERARAILGFGREAVAHVLDLARKGGVACDLEQTGLVCPAVSPGQLKRAMRLHIDSRYLGLEGEFWDRERCAVLGVPFFRGAFYDPCGALLDPYKLARGVLGLARSMGVEVYEQTELTGLRPGATIEARAGAHRIRAGNVLFATNAYTTQRPFRGWFAPLHVYTVVTEPLTAAQLEAIGGWPGRQGFYTLHHILYALRLTADNRLVAATGNVLYFWNNRLHVADRPEEYRRLEEAIAWFYPALRGLRIEFRWEGVIGVTLSDFPALGRSGRFGNVFHSLAYCGHGVALANYSGSVIRDLFLERPGVHQELPFVGRPPFPPTPGEPLRKLVASAYIGTLRALDALSNLRART
jgi:glycine/D-amino acid oxidase-like deaminating enzyme